MTRLSIAWAAVLAGLFAPSARADDPAKPGAPPAPAAPPGATYSDPTGRLTVEGPSGWTLKKDAGGVPTWARLCAFDDPVSKATAIVSARRAQALSLARLRDEVTKVFAADSTFKVTSITDLPIGGTRPLPGILVDAVQTRLPDPLPPGTPPPAAPPLPMVLRANAAYLLGGETEYMVYVEARTFVWARIAPLVDRMIQGVVVKVEGSAVAPRGGGAFRDEVAGFACAFPAGYGVSIPGRENNVVTFSPGTDGPVIGVFRYAEGDVDVDADAKSLVAYYTGEEVGGEAAVGTVEVAGRSGALVTAKGKMAGRDQVFFVAVVKRGGDLFRLRVAAPSDQQEKARQVFQAFVKSFVLTNG